MAAFEFEGDSYTPKQIEVLCRLANGVVPLKDFVGWDRNAIAKLEDLDAVEEIDLKARITDKGRRVIASVNARVNGTKPPAVETKPAKAETPSAPRETNPPARETPPPQARDRLARLRAEIVARYEADLAALDRLSEIARAVGA